jgi:hypothetical protein
MHACYYIYHKLQRIPSTYEWGTLK